ncbi:hypothetical protein KHS38_05875 [Mucilaginibacter sp. Bleaf8]|uniref:putative sensor domain DACNV-containing protein n=1 Tax=Mucilaginibacter sp. Bleaf8 TaxID=2834430 RepID=UPI001BCE249A|nr:hypothetical protein [Mucilaginibacter sp. Bleaf8]MBS7563927.1 hypothetical protein [Mucilaginibacter sp. Bleaf8]
MISEPSYLAARMVSGTISNHFAYHLDTADCAGKCNLAPQPELQCIEAIIDVAFWASLRREEGHSPKISLALLPPDKAKQPLMFKNKLRLTPNNLTKLGPAVEKAGIHLGVWHDDSGMYVWGSVLALPGICFVLEVIEPGLLVVKHSRADGFGKFINVAILKGDEIKIVNERRLGMGDSPALVASLLGMPLPDSQDDAVNVLIELAGAMREHGRGGIVLVVPDNTTAWHESIVHPISYPIVPAYCGITDLMKEDITERSKPSWREALTRVIDTVGGYTAVDGATVITHDYHMLAFGAKVTRAKNSMPVQEILVTEPVEDSTGAVIHPVQNGGTRHLAGAQFVYDQRDSLALVASQDGHFTIFSWSNQLNKVHAHRIDALLL